MTLLMNTWEDNVYVNRFIARRPLGTESPSGSAQRSKSTKVRIYKQFKGHEHRTTLITQILIVVHSKHCIYISNIIIRSSPNIRVNNSTPL